MLERCSWKAFVSWSGAQRKENWDVWGRRQSRFGKRQKYQISYKLSLRSKTSRRDEYYIYIHKFLSIDLWLAVGAGSVSPGSWSLFYSIYVLYLQWLWFTHVYTSTNTGMSLLLPYVTNQMKALLLLFLQRIICCKVRRVMIEFMFYL